MAALPFALGGLGSFVNLDDNNYVYENPVVRGGISADALRWAFTTFATGNWHPLTWVSHLLDVSLFGLDARWHHAVGIALHAVNTTLLFLALSRLTGIAGASLFAAALFGVHPLHVESVAWVAERKDLLSALFFMLVLLAYASYVRKGGVGRYLRVVLALSLGLMAKPMLVTTPFVLLLLDWWPLGRWRAGRAPAGQTQGRPRPWQLLVEKVPLLLLCIVSAVVTILAQRSTGAVLSLHALSLAQRAGNAAHSYATYLLQTAWPHELAVYYPFPAGGLPSLEVAGSLLLLGAITAVVIAQVARRPYLALGWCWFLGVLVPVIGLVQVGNQARADRYTYLPVAGLFIAASWLALESRRARLVWAVPLAGAATLLTLTSLSAAQARHWGDSRALFSRTLAVTRNNPLAHHNLGTALREAGALDEAAAQFRAALAALPEFPEARFNLGLTLALLGSTDEAQAHYREALRLRPDFAEAHVGLGIAMAKRRRNDEAERHFREAIRLRPGSFEAHANLGGVLALQGRFEEARRAYREALQVRPDSEEVKRLLARLPAPPG